MTKQNQGMIVSEYIVNYLCQHGTRVVFGVGGANIEDIYDALFYYGKNIQVVIAKHEFSAITMADGYSRMHGELGVVISTSGGGAFNLVAGIAEAFASSIPLLVIIGQIPQALEGKGGFQDTSGNLGTIVAENVFRPISKYCHRVNQSAQIPEVLHDAIQKALEMPQGPALLLIPKNIQSEFLSPDALAKTLPKQLTANHMRVNNEELVKLFTLFNTPSTKISIICGATTLHPGIKPLIQKLASSLNATVAVTATAKAAFDNSSPNYIGVVGAMGYPSTLELLKNTDTFILIGTRLSVMSRFGLETVLLEKNIVYINDRVSFFDYQNNCAIKLTLLGSVSAILTELLEDLAIKNFKPSIETQLTTTPITFLTTDAWSVETPCLTFKELMCVLNNMIEPNANVVVDAGNTGAAAVHYVNAPPNGTFTIALGMGGMGYSFGAAIGACLANGHNTYIIAGDGSFYMHGSEIHTAVELGLPIVFIIINNNSHAMCVTRESIYFKSPYTYNQFKKTAIGAGIAAMFPSISAYTVTSADEFKVALEQSTCTPYPSFICVEMETLELPPFQPFLQKLATRN